MSCILPQNMANIQDIQVFFVIPSHMKSLSETQWIHALRLLPPNSLTKFFLLLFLKKHTISEHRILYFLIFAKYLTIFTTIH